jgi:hypothetical protein
MTMLQIPVLLPNVSLQTTPENVKQLIQNQIDDQGVLYSWSTPRPTTSADLLFFSDQRVLNATYQRLRDRNVKTFQLIGPSIYFATMDEKAVAAFVAEHTQPEHITLLSYEIREVRASDFPDLSFMLLIIADVLLETDSDRQRRKQREQEFRIVQQPTSPKVERGRRTRSQHRQRGAE